MQRIDGHVHLEHGPLSAAYVEQFVSAAQKADWTVCRSWTIPTASVNSGRPTKA